MLATEKFFTVETRDMSQLCMEKIQRPQNERFYGAST